jgi:hypothetical protein
MGMVEAAAFFLRRRRIRRNLPFEPIEAMILMAPAISPFFHDPSFDPFLFAAIGEERNGMLLSVLSALARLELDPWREAESLSKLSPPVATERLTSLLSALPSAQLKTPAPATIMRLVGLLPRAARGEERARGASGAARSKMSWPIVVYVILAFVMMFAKQIEERGVAQLPTGGGAWPAASVSETGAATPQGESRGDTHRGAHGIIAR